MSYTTKVIQINVYKDRDDPMSGDSVTQLIINDEGAGPYLEIRQSNEWVENGEIRLEFDEIDAIFNTAKRLVNEFENG